MSTDTLNGRRIGRVLGCATQGSGGDDEARLKILLSNFEAEYVPFDRRDKKASFFKCLRMLRENRFDLLVLEGTGIAGGVAAILGRLLYKRRYVLSSGDAVAPFLRSSFRLGTPLFEAYERLLYRASSGFVGWTPYLVGRALTLGARRAVTIPGWAPYSVDHAELLQERVKIRRDLDIPEDAIVFGIAGNLSWSKRYQYCYGSELVRAAQKAGSGTYVLIVGDGSGLEHLKTLASNALGKTVFLTGRVPRERVPAYLAAMDIGSLPQSVDGVGSFRYSTKITEYRGVELPFVTNQIPMAYDLDRGDTWRLPGDSPWSDTFIEALGTLMRSVTLDEIAAHRASAVTSESFDRDVQVRRFTFFLQDILNLSILRTGIDKQEAVPKSQRSD